MFQDLPDQNGEVPQPHPAQDDKGRGSQGDEGRVLALLPIGGHFTMDPAHAAYAISKLLKVKNVIPMHYGTFGLLKGRPAHLVKALGGYPAKVIALNPGDKFAIGK